MKRFLSNLLAPVMLVLAFIAAILPLTTFATAVGRVFDMREGWRFNLREQCQSIAASFRQTGMLAYSNSGLTALIPSLYASLDVVSRELAGMIPTVSRDSNMERAAVGQSVTIEISPAASASDITPGVTPPNDGDQTFDNLQVTMTKSRRVPFRWTGEEQRGLDNNGAGSQNLMNDQIAQAFRTLVNEMEADTWNAGRKMASRAYGTAGTTPFATNLAEAAQLRKILDDNGCPAGDRACTIDTTAGANMRTLTQLTKVNEAGTSMTLRDGELMNLFGMSFHESAAVNQVVKGTGASYTTNAAGYAKGATAITVITGAGTILAGDVITFAGDTNKYVVTGALAGGVVTIGKPGLRVAIPASATAVTVVGNATMNLAYHRSAILLATRAPALPKGGDMARDRMMITDPRSGISFEIAQYPQYRQMQYEISATWGTAGIKAENVALLLG